MAKIKPLGLKPKNRVLNDRLVTEFTRKGNKNGNYLFETGGHSSI